MSWLAGGEGAMTSRVAISASELESRVSTPFDVEAVRKDFPALHQQVHGKPLVYLDNAASAQVPQAVIDAITKYYAHDRANVHRGVHELSQRATDDYENARVEIQRFIGAADYREIIYTRGATESINLVAQSFVPAAQGRGRDCDLRHGASFEHRPWQMLRDEYGAKLRVAPINDDGELLFAEFEKLLNERTKLVSVNHVSNALGTVNPVREIIASAHSRGIPVLLDGAQAIPHMSVDVRELDCDFYAFSGHKLFGPNGIGILYGKRELLEAMPPYQGGGDMISSVTFEKTIYNELPYKFEAGTPNVAGAIGLGAAVAI
jgi:cysteine desulfurase / selenocysteine lyase